jgi:hypothetical protein
MRSAPNQSQRFRRKPNMVRRVGGLGERRGNGPPERSVRAPTSISRSVWAAASRSAAASAAASSRSWGPRREEGRTIWCGRWQWCGERPLPDAAAAGQGAEAFGAPPCKKQLWGRLQPPLTRATAALESCSAASRVAACSERKQRARNVGIAVGAGACALLPCLQWYPPRAFLRWNQITSRPTATPHPAPAAAAPARAWPPQSLPGSRRTHPAPKAARAPLDE